MLKHVFTTREKILILVCAILALAIFYYEFAYKGFQNALTQYDTTTLETELSTEQAKAMRLKQMQAYLDEHADDTFGSVEPYNNLSNEVTALGEILNGAASDISISWSEPTASDVTVRRIASISFKTGSYASAENLIQQINDCRYRCVISDLQLNANDGNMGSSSVSVSMNSTFFETTEGATTTNGIVFETTEDTGTSTN